MIGLIGIAAACGGCGSLRGVDPDRWLVARPAAGHAADTVIRRDPAAYLRRVAERCTRLEQYRVRLVRIERRGIGPFAGLHGPEHIAAWFRRRPFSVRLVWLDPDSPHDQSVYVEGRNDGRVLYRPRRGLFGSRPTVLRVRPQTVVRLGQSRVPITDFGLERLMQRTVATIARAADAAQVRYLGRVRIDDLPRPVHAFEVRVPRRFSDPPAMELYIDPVRELPCGAVLRSAAGTLQAAYFYRDLRTDVSLTDADFTIHAPPDERRSTP